MGTGYCLKKVVVFFFVMKASKDSVDIIGFE